MIPKFATIFWMCFIAFAAFGLYMVKYRVLDIQKEIARTEHELEEEKENLHVIAAEWAYLNRPDRLQPLAQKYLKLEPMKGVQIGSLEQLPYPGQEMQVAQPAAKAARGIVPAVAVQPAAGEVE